MCVPRARASQQNDVQVHCKKEFQSRQFFRCSPRAIVDAGDAMWADVDAKKNIFIIKPGKNWSICLINIYISWY